MPRVERGEAFNAGIVLHSRPHRYLGARTELDEAVLAALSPDCDPETVREHLALIDRIAAGDADAGPIAALSAPERFHWLVSPVVDDDPGVPGAHGPDGRPGARRSTTCSGPSCAAPDAPAAD